MRRVNGYRSRARVWLEHLGVLVVIAGVVLAVAARRREGPGRDTRELFEDLERTYHRLPEDFVVLEGRAREAEQLLQSDPRYFPIEPWRNPSSASGRVAGYWPSVLSGPPDSRTGALAMLDARRAVATGGLFRVHALAKLEDGPRGQCRVRLFVFCRAIGRPRRQLMDVLCPPVGAPKQITSLFGSLGGYPARRGVRAVCGAAGSRR